MFTRNKPTAFPGAGIHQRKGLLQPTLEFLFLQAVSAKIDVQISVTRMTKARDAKANAFRDLIGITDELRNLCLLYTSDAADE